MGLLIPGQITDIPQAIHLMDGWWAPSISLYLLLTGFFQAFKKPQKYLMHSYVKNTLTLKSMRLSIAGDIYDGINTLNIFMCVLILKNNVEL